MKTQSFILVPKIFTGEYKKDELLEAARSGNEDKLMSLLTPLNVNCHASDGRKVGAHSLKVSAYVSLISLVLHLITISG